MAGFVPTLPLRFSTIACVVVLATPAVSAAQSGGWSEPIAAPPKAEPAPPPPEPAIVPAQEPPPPSPPPASTEPNPDWADPPPTEFEERSPQNPDWVEETEAPPVGKMRRRASEFYDFRFANRDLTMPRGMMRGTFDTVVGRRSEDPQGLQEPFGPTGTISTMNFGVALTVAKDFEIGFSRYRMGSFPSINIYPGFGFGGEGLITFSMSPETKFGDIPFYGRFQVLDRDNVKMAFDAVFRIPSRTNFGFLGGVPLRFIAAERFAFDTGVEMVVDDNPQGPSVWSMNIPFKFAANATDALFFEFKSGMHFFDLSQTIRTATSGLIQGPFYFIPLGAGAGYTVEARATMMDVFVNFNFPTFYGFTSRANELNAETWQVTIGFNVYTPILFKGSAL
jgi:hypothetical protein